MRYVMKQRWLAWGDDFNIQDAQGNDVFFVDGHALSLGDKLSFQDMSGNELTAIFTRRNHVADCPNCHEHCNLAIRILGPSKEWPDGTGNGLLL